MEKMNNSDYSWKDFDIIDTHAHVFPAKVAEKAAHNIGDFYDLPSRHDGSCEALLENGSAFGVKKYVICSVATTPEQVGHINTFISSQQNAHKEFYGFGALHPFMTGLEDEVERIKRLGLHGIKLHADFQRFYIDSPEAYALYEMVGDSLPILFHVGDDRYDYSRPAKLAKVAEDFPKLRIIAAHLGGFRKWDEAWDYLKKPGIKYDVSSTMPVASIERTRRQIYHMGVENCFFGTDYPLWNYGDAIARFMSLKLPYEDCKAIFADNFRAFMGF